MIVDSSVLPNTPPCAPKTLDKVEITPATELRHPGLVSRKHEEKLPSQRCHSHEDAVSDPDIIFLPSPPQPEHSTCPDTCANPCDDIPVSMPRLMKRDII